MIMAVNWVISSQAMPRKCTIQLSLRLVLVLSGYLFSSVLPLPGVIFVFILTAPFKDYANIEIYYLNKKLAF